MKSGAHISAGVGENRRGYRYLTKAWGWPDGTQSRAPEGVNVICLLFLLFDSIARKMPRLYQGKSELAGTCASHPVQGLLPP
jgi:hypothetical protein